MVGLERGKVKLEQHSEEWKELYKDEVKNLKSLLPAELKDFEHIGSTAIKGISAKPIIDMIAAVENLEQTDNIIQTLENNGYEERHKDGVEDRIFLAKGDRDNRTHYLSLTEEKSNFYKRTTKFRDKLNQNPELAQKYNRLKKKLAEKHPEDREKYTESKTKFIQKVVKDMYWAEKYLRGETSFQNFKLIDSFEGDNNQNIVFKTEDQKYVLRKKKEISDNQDTLENERKILKFLEHNNIDSVPKSVKYDSKRSIHIISFVGKEEVNVENLELEKLTEWTQNLAKMHKLTFKEYKEFCRQENFSFEKPKTPDEKLESIEKDLEEVKEYSGQDNLIRYCEERINELKENLTVESSSAGLTHNDIANSTRRTENDFFFIDWEFAGFNYRPFTDLAILFAHHDLSEEKEQKIKESYKDEVNVSKDFEEELQKAKTMRHVFNTTWCLKRAEKTEDEEERQRYLKFAKKQKGKTK